MEATIERPGQPAIPGLMTEAEARDTVRRIRECCESAGVLILDLRDREGWRALGYGSWRECAAQELGMSVGRVYQLATHEAIARTMERAGLPRPVNERQSRELARLPEDDRVPVWAEVQKVASERNLTAEVVCEVIRRRRPAALSPWYLRKSEPDPCAETEAEWLASQGLSVPEGLKLLRRFFAVCERRGYAPALYLDLLEREGDA